MAASSLPRPIPLHLEGSVLDLYRAHGEQSQSDSYAGVRLVKLPQDLRIYEHILWLSAPRFVVELGVQHGGSALWFRDRLMTLANYGRIRHPGVIGIDIDIEAARENLAAADPAYAETITLVEGDVRDTELARSIAGLIEPGAPVLVVDDSAHTFETTTAALNGYSGLVQPGGWFVVEDGGVDIDEIRLDPSWPRGVIPAIDDWLQTPAGRRFTIRRDVELYGITANPQGFLQRVS